MSQPVSNASDVNQLLLPAIISVKQQQGFGAANRQNPRETELVEEARFSPEPDRFEATETIPEETSGSLGYAEIFEQFQRDQEREEQQRRFEDTVRAQFEQNNFETVDREYALNLARAVTGVYDFNSEAVFLPPNPGGNLNLRA